MEPTLRNGTTVLVSSIPLLFSKPTVSDIVIFQQKGEVFIKRVQKVEEDKYFLVGDNEYDSMDSRKIGWVTRNDIIGKVISN